MFNELDVVKTNKKIAESVPKNTRGVVHQIYPSSPNFYLVEFVDNESNTICILEVSEGDIELSSVSNNTFHSIIGAMSNPVKQETDFVIKQREICNRYSADFLEVPFDKMIGVALETFDKFNMPINGLRHPIQSEESANWYIWAGEYSDADNFFKPVHVQHLLEICPKAINYLGLAPGWRFLFDNTYEDVWYDAALLNI